MLRAEYRDVDAHMAEEETNVNGRMYPPHKASGFRLQASSFELPPLSLLASVTDCGIANTGLPESQPDR
jgi:hypothetical protein